MQLYVWTILFNEISNEKYKIYAYARNVAEARQLVRTKYKDYTILSKFDSDPQIENKPMVFAIKQGTIGSGWENF